jgi:hypothetical protein
MKAKHIVIGIAAIGTGALAVVNYAFEHHTPDLCESPEKFIYANYIRQVETRFSGKQLFDAEKSDVGSDFKCQPTKKDKDGNQLYNVKSGNIYFVIKTGTSKESGKPLMGILSILSNTGDEQNTAFQVHYEDLLAKKMAEMEANKK